ncbi:peptidylprolyl isomerase [Marinilabilia sp.]|uniref:peptidylprolyl isomerase n=1 Tax=Marinilabilia sp. TaxID=2021252 RepID=UPI0025C0B597|nr:peptidylprolyl isomerase [Marinilabilia sp.]
MRKMRKLITFLIAGFFLFSVESARAQEYTHYVLVKTNLGNMKVKLYNDTPNHRNEFLKLVNSDHFDGTLFYRVIKNFVIQGGSADSRNAPAGKHIGYGNAAVNIDSEFHDHHFHKKGALCAPRQPEDINHFKMSDISQFYIVKGRVWTSEQLDIIEKNNNIPIKNKLKKEFYVPRKEELARLKEEDPRAFNELLRDIKQKINFEYSLSDYIKFSDAQREAYTTIGGLPDLDGDYTVFGEVVEGFDVIDKIAALKTDKNDRPFTDVVIQVGEVTQ